MQKLKTFLLVAIFYSTYISILVAANSDSTLSAGKPWYKTSLFKTTFTPGLIIGYGLSVQRNNGWPVSSYQTMNYLQVHAKNFHTNIDNYLPYTPAIGVYALNMTGIMGIHRFTDRTFLYAGSFGFAEVIVYSLKSSTHVLRPNHSAYNSFPSGHTMAAFVAAEFMHQEFSEQSAWYSVAGYTIAGATAALRMLNNDHWLSDVVVGAGIGILCTRIVYIAYPWCKERILDPIFNKKRIQQ